MHEALHLSAKEEITLDSLLDSMRAGYSRPIDAFSQDLLIAQLEVLLSYSNQFYHRQFPLTQRAPYNGQSTVNED